MAFGFGRSVTKARKERIERFNRLAEQRTQKALDAIRILSNCAAKTTYEYTPDQVHEIEAALFDAVYELSDRFKKGK